MMLIRVSFLIAIYCASCCYSSRLYQSLRGPPDGSRNNTPHLRPETDEVVENTRFEQKLNHFNETDTRTWEQRYHLNDEYYKKGGPVYLWIEGSEYPYVRRIQEGYWVSHAKKHNGMIFSLTHRIHYHSQVMGDTSLQSLTYLNMSQALSDCAAFIQGMNNLHELPQDTKWIVFGSSYGGYLAAWMRTKYPRLVHGAVASSAPVFAKMNFTEYLANVERSIKSFNKTCSKDIGLANEKLDELVKTEKGRKEIKETFTLCDSLDGTSLSTSTFMDDMTRFIGHEIQTDLANKKLKKSCDTLLKDADKKTPVQRYARLMNKYLEENDKKCIVSNFDALVKPLQKVNAFSSYMTGRAWRYQLCNEFGWFQLGYSKISKTFSRNLNSEFYVQVCSKIFASTFDRKFISQSVDKTNNLFGGDHFNTSRTLFVHGTLDPWRSLGITRPKKDGSVEVILIKGGTHATDTSYEHSKSKHRGRKAAIDKIMAKLDSWLKK